MPPEFKLQIRGNANTSNSISPPGRQTRNSRSRPKSKSVPSKATKRTVSKKTTVGKRKKTVVVTEEYVVESLLGKRRRNGVDEYYVKWKGYSNSDNSWEPIHHLTNSKALVDDYNGVQDSGDEKRDSRERTLERETNENEKAGEDEVKDRPMSPEVRKGASPSLCLIQGHGIKEIKGVIKCPKTEMRSYIIHRTDDTETTISESLIRTKYPQHLMDYLTSRIVWIADSNQVRVVLERISLSENTSTEDLSPASLNKSNVANGNGNASSDEPFSSSGTDQNENENEESSGSIHENDQLNESSSSTRDISYDSDRE